MYLSSQALQKVEIKGRPEHLDTHIPMFIAALFTIAKLQK
jgi:hypothetical protein